jgi:hypothetical protein
VVGRGVRVAAGVARLWEAVKLCLHFKSNADPIA